MRGATSILREDVGWPVTGRMELSGSTPYIQAEFVRHLQSGAVSVQRRSTDTERLSKAVKQNGKKLALVSVQRGAERFLEITADRDELLLRLNEYKVFKESWERKLWNVDVIWKVLIASVRKLKKKLSS